MNEVNPKKIWNRLTLLLRLFALLSAMSAGGWITGFLVRPDPISEKEMINYYYEAARTWDPKYGARARSFDKSPDWQNLFNDPNWVDQQIEEWVRNDVERQIWKSRRRVQKPSAIVFISCLIITGVFAIIRKDPFAFDGSIAGLPKQISDRVPFILARWRVKIEDENGNQIFDGLYRTASKAIKKARELVGKGSAKVEWDNSGHEAYKQFIKEHTNR